MITTNIYEELQKRASEGKNIRLGMVGFGHDDTVWWAKSGRVDFVTVGGDTGILIAAYKHDLEAIRG